MASHSLLGPPEIYASSSASATGDGNNHPTFGFTENNSLTYTATGNPCLDFFFHVVPNTPKKELIERLLKAWSFDPLTTLKLICNLRGVRGTGKSDKEQFYTAALWLHCHHPKTLACNVKVLAEFGYYKDLLEILFRILEGEDARLNLIMEWRSRKGNKARQRVQVPRHFSHRRRKMVRRNKNKDKNSTIKTLSREIRVKQNDAKVQAEKEHARCLRKEKVIAKAKKAHQRYNRDHDYRFLHDCVADFFAEALKADLRYLNIGEFYKISLASKWCPSIDSAYDKRLLICESIARRIFPRESDPDYLAIEEAHYAYRVRDRLRKQVLVPLHKVLELPEVYMSANQWDSLPYNRVPSVAIKNYKSHFLKHDNKRFKAYLDDVEKGKASIAAGALLPHEIIASLWDADGGQVVELQWNRMVDDLAKKGKMNNCIAVCDVSGSMCGTPMKVCVALGLMISELSDDPWKGKVITFSERPQLHMIQGDSLLEKTNFVRNMQWGYNTNFQKVFDEILKVAVEGNLTKDQIIRKIFVFSDMEFDEANGHYNYKGYYSSESEFESESEGDSDFETENNHRPKGWETDYEVIQRKFREKGYNKVPEIVFWNLRNSWATPVDSKQSGVALVSGFSKNMVKLFLENGGIISPVAVMHEAISGEFYQKLVVID